MTRVALMRRCVSVLVVLVMSLAAAVAGASPAAAAAAPGTGKVKIDDWPSELRWALPNTEEFYGAYMFKEAGQPCSKEAGGNAYRYVMDYLDHTGEVFQMISHTTGTPVLAITDIGGARTDLPQLSSVEVPLKSGMAIPGLYPAPKNPQNISGKAWCGNDFAQFGVSDLQAPFGFGFYSNPDAASVKFIDKYVSLRPSWKKYWDKRYEKGFDARNLDSYCAQDNPFCLTASFLHCDQRAGDAPDPSLVSWCQTWNYNVAIYNARLMELVRLYGTNSFDANGALVGPLKPLDVASNAVRATPDPLGAPTTDLATIGRDGYLARWAAAMALPDYLSYLRGLGKALTIGTAVGLGAAAGIAAFWLGAGLLGSLLIGGAVTAFTVFSGDCGLSGLSKCLAKMAADGMRFTLSSVPDAAAATQLPNMTSSIWKSTFSDIATVSVAMLLVLFIINLIMSLVAGKPQLIVRSFLGVGGYFVVLSAGGALLSLLVAARNAATQKISGGPGFMDEVTNRIIDAINKMGADGNFDGWLLVFVLCGISMVCGFIVMCILYLSNAWVPLIICILILQLAGWAAPGLSASKWFRRGTGILWTTLLMAPVIAVIWRGGIVAMANKTDVVTLAWGTATIAASALVPGIVASLFSLGVSGKLGLHAGALGAGLAALGMGKALGGLAGGGASMRPGKQPGELTDDQLAYGSRIAGGGGSGGLSGIASKITPTTSYAGAAGSSGGGTDGWASGKDDNSSTRGKHSAGNGERSRISAVTDSSGTGPVSGSRGALTQATAAPELLPGTAAAGAAAAGIGAAVALDKALVPDSAGISNDRGADAASGVGAAGVAGAAPDGSSRSTDPGSVSSAGVQPPAASVPDVAGSGPGSGEVGRSAVDQSPTAPAAAGGAVVGQSGASSVDTTGTAPETGSGPGLSPAGGGSSPAGGGSARSAGSVPAAIPPVGPGSAPGTPGTPPPSPTRSRAGMQGQGWNAPGGVPSGSITGSSGSPGGDPAAGAGQSSRPPGSPPAGVPWGVPINEESPGPAPTAAEELPSWHAYDIPWGAPREPDHDPDRSGIPSGDGEQPS